MGLCVDANENNQGLTFVINTDSITFYEDFYCGEVGNINNVKMDKKILKKIVALCNSPKWNKKY